MGYNPSYKWINHTYPIYNWGYNPLTKWDDPPSILNSPLLPIPAGALNGHHADAMTGHQLAILGPGPGWNGTGWHPVTCHRSVPKMGVAKVMVPPNQHSIVGLSNLWGLGDPSWHIGKPKRFSAVLERVGGKSPFPHRAKGDVSMACEQRWQCSQRIRQAILICVGGLLQANMIRWIHVNSMVDMLGLW